METEYQIPKTVTDRKVSCPWCRKDDLVMGDSTPGTITICRHCVQPSVLEGGGGLRQMTDEDVSRLPLRHILTLGFAIVGLRQANERLKDLN